MWTEWINFGISFLIVFAGLLLVGQLLAALLIRLARQTSSEYDEAYVRSIKPQIVLLVLVISLNFATSRLLSIPGDIKQTLTQVYYAIIILILAVIIWKLIDFLGLWYKDLAKQSGETGPMDAALLLAQRAGKALLVIVSIIMILGNFGVNVSALVATLGIGGLAISLAAQDTLSNMVSGIMILMDQPFRIGDRIEIQGLTAGLNTWGEVVDIGLRSTRIRTSDNRMVIVPNSNISKNQVINYTYPDPRYRVQMDIGVTDGSDLRVVRDVITQAVRSVEGVLVDRPVEILFMAFDELKISLRVCWWIESYTDSKQELDLANQAIYLALKEAGIEKPSSTMANKI
jgi:MscS family membrane protein